MASDNINRTLEEGFNKIGTYFWSDGGHLTINVQTIRLIIEEPDKQTYQLHLDGGTMLRLTRQQRQSLGLTLNKLGMI